MYVHSILIDNVKAFEQVILDFKRPASEDAHPYAGLNIFVGGNSSGKSTLLKALAMAMSGPLVANQQLLSPAGWVRKGSTKGTIELDLFWDDVTDAFRGKGATPNSRNFKLGIVFDAPKDSPPTLKERHFSTKARTKVRLAERGPWNQDAPGWFLGAYGPLRRLTGSSTDALRYSLGKGNLASCVTLFREDAALAESETWIKQEHARSLEQKDPSNSSSQLVENVRRLFNDGLLPQGFSISRITVDHVYMTTPNGGELPLRDLSDGCRSTYALMLDIIHSMSLAYRTTDLFSSDSQGRIVVSKPGVILIDELEAHLHPAWQRQITEWLKIRFPKIQFFVTTHSPLIAQGADLDGVFVLPLPHELLQGDVVRRLQDHEYERVALGRADSVLLGEAFGLKQTWSTRTQHIVEQWERFTAQRKAKREFTQEQRRTYQHLEEQIRLIFEDEPDFNA